MSGAPRPVVRLKETLNLDDLLLSNFGSNDSPLQLMSPNVVHNKSLNTKDMLDIGEQLNEPKIKAVGNRIANCQDAHGDEEEGDELAPLPALKNKKKADPRRQSTAIFSIFEATTSGTSGLLGESELAIGDEDMELLIPLAKSNATLASKGINNLWVDPDTDDAMLEETLPEPTLEELQAVASAAAISVPSPSKEKRTGTAMGVRDSVAMFAGFSLACDSSPGIDKVREDDFLSPRNGDNQAPLVAKEEKKEVIVKVAAPVRKPSRLKPPSSSSSFFSHKTTTTTRTQVARPPAAVAVSQPKEQKITSSAVESKPTKRIIEKVEPQKQILPEPQPRKLAPSRLPAAVHLKSRLPRPAPPPTTAKSVTTADAKPKRVLPKATAAVAKTPVVVAKTTIAATSSSPADDTPRTAHLRWLEQHPELAFGGGSKLADFPEPEEVPKKKSAEEMHYESWGNSLTALNDRK